MEYVKKKSGRVSPMFRDELTEFQIGSKNVIIYLNTL